MARYLLDTTVLIDHLRGRQEVVELVTTLAQQGHELRVCCVNIAELYSGIGHGERSKADLLTDAMGFQDVTPQIAKEAGRYRHDFARPGRTLSVADTLIAAAAIAGDATLITANTADFPMSEIQLQEQP